MVKQSNKTNKTENKLSVERNESLYKGVRQRKWGKWVSEIRLPNSRQRIWLGSYDTPQKAARAFDAALFCLRGYSAKFNFPDNLPDMAADTGRSLNPSEIQAVAARFANSEPSTSQLSGSQTEYSSPSPSTSISEDTVQLESDGAFNGSFSDLLTTTDSSNYGSDYGMTFEDLDDLYKDILASSPLPAVDYGDGNLDGFLVEDTFLWNF